MVRFTINHQGVDMIACYEDSTLQRNDTARLVLLDVRGTSVLLNIKVTRSPRDGVLVVQIDTPGLGGDAQGPKCRVYLNDHCMHENPPFPNT